MAALVLDASVALAAVLPGEPASAIADAVMSHLSGEGAAVRLATSRGLTLYDAAYLELAVRLKLPLASLDRALGRAAEAERVVLANPPA